jgi:ubiquitin-activating enzyme E1 C
MQFKMIVCGLDSIEARRWINATLVGMVDMQNPESLKPLIDGGTEGRSLDSLQGRMQMLTHCMQVSRDKQGSSYPP